MAVLRINIINKVNRLQKRIKTYITTNKSRGIILREYFELDVIKVKIKTRTQLTPSIFERINEINKNFKQYKREQEEMLSQGILDDPD